MRSKSFSLITDRSNASAQFHNFVLIVCTRRKFYYSFSFFFFFIFINIFSNNLRITQI